MNLQEYHSLSNRYTYDFYLYHVEKPYYGILIHVHEEKSYYIVHPRDQNDYLTKGKKVKLESIKKWDQITPGQPRSNSSGGYSIAHPQRKAKKLVILGAGASYDHSYGDSEKTEAPPLANDLFHDRYDSILSNFPGARALAADILLSNNIEAYFQKQWLRLENHYDPVLFRQLINVQYYLYYLMREASRKCEGIRTSNYNVLAKYAREYAESRDELVMFVNFNYDILLEEALTRTAGYKYNNIQDYIDAHRKHILLFKPHGSCNWGRTFRKEFIGTIGERADLRNVEGVARVLFESGYLMHSITEHLEPETGLFPIGVGPIESAGVIGKSIFPQILIPYKDKDEFVMPDDHIMMMNNTLRDVEEILIIGWKGTEELFMKRLKDSIGNTQVKITVVNMGDTSKETEEILRGSLSNIKELRFCENGFSDFVRKELAGSESHLFSVV